MKSWKEWPILEMKTGESDFPENLRTLKSGPKRMFYRGNMSSDIFKKTMAVVGSRRMTRYGREVIRRFIPFLVNNQVTIISGFMYGIDSEAHRVCVENGGKTVAILGSGLDCLFPQENEVLYTSILENGGLVMSEFPNQFKPTVWSFPQRNRIVSALSTKGILIVEAGLKSGSLLTARIGIKQGKKIMAVPGPISSSISEGTNWLIKLGMAQLISEPSDLLTADESQYIQQTIIGNLTEDEEIVVRYLKTESLSLNEITAKLNIDIDEASVLMTGLLIKDIVAEDGDRFNLK